MKFAIVVSEFNREITDGLLKGAVDALLEMGVMTDGKDIYRAPGAFELPLIAKALAKSGGYAGVICLGSVIKGETAHFEFISLGSTVGIMNAMLDTGVPISFGVLTSYNEEQAQARSRNNPENKGREAALACWSSALTLKRIGELDA